MSKGYLSEITIFMNKYLKDNPEVVKAQQVGRNSQWQDQHAAVEPVTKLNENSSE